MLLVLQELMNLDKLLGIKKFEVIALPLKIKADSSIARVVAKVISKK
jgi:kynurenine formamidase